MKIRKERMLREDCSVNHALYSLESKKVEDSCVNSQSVEFSTTCEVPKT